MLLSLLGGLTDQRSLPNTRKSVQSNTKQIFVCCRTLPNTTVKPLPNVTGTPNTPGTPNMRSARAEHAFSCHLATDSRSKNLETWTGGSTQADTHFTPLGQNPLTTRSGGSDYYLQRILLTRSNLNLSRTPVVVVAVINIMIMITIIR